MDRFLVASCPSCERDPVLVAWDLAEEELVPICLHCDTRLNRANARAASPMELAEMGYDVEPGGGGDGGRGCRDGQCGVRQPES